MWLLAAKMWREWKLDNVLWQIWRPLDVAGYVSGAFNTLNLRLLIQISQKFVVKGPIDSKAAMGQIIAWHWLGDKPLSEPIVEWCHLINKNINSQQNFHIWNFL